MPSLPFPPAANAEWSDEITDVAVGEMRGKIWVFDPDPAGKTPYNALTDAGGKPGMVTVLSNRRARIQHGRNPVSGASSDSWDPKRNFRFQIDLLPGDPLILKGMIVRVTDGHKDPSLQQFAYTVESATNSSQAALRTIVAVSEASPSPMPPLVP